MNYLGRPAIAPAFTADRASKGDRTNTGAIRRAFEADAARRMRLLRRLVVSALGERDVLGITTPSPAASVFLRTFNTDRLPSPIIPPSFVGSTRDRLIAFAAWLEDQAGLFILDAARGIDPALAGVAWIGNFMTRAFRAGISQGDAALRKIGINLRQHAPHTPGQLTATETAAMVAAISKAVSDMQNVVAETVRRVVSEVGQAIDAGNRARQVAMRAGSVIDKVGEIRARVTARVSTIAAHAAATLEAFKAAAIESVGVEVEWATAGDGNVCPSCSVMAGRVMPIRDAEGLIPLHPNCRCSFIPVR